MQATHRMPHPYLPTLPQDSGDSPRWDLTDEGASKLIDALQQRTGRGIDR